MDADEFASAAEYDALLRQLRTAGDTSLADVVSVACSIVERTVELLAAVQAVPRDPYKEFEPCSDHGCSALTMAAADSALMLLSELCHVGEARCRAEEWEPIGPGTAVGATLYRNKKTRVKSEQPTLSDAAARGWQGKLLMEVPLLIIPSTLDGGQTVTWAVRVVGLSSGSGKNGGDAAGNTEVVAVLDMLSFDDEGIGEGVGSGASDSTKRGANSGGAATAASEAAAPVTMRRMYRGPWQGLEQEPYDESVLHVCSFLDGIFGAQGRYCTVLAPDGLQPTDGRTRCSVSLGVLFLSYSHHL
jgi:hypothetical protein